MLVSIAVLIFYFNPRSREGSDSYVIQNRLHLFISIHAPARGATRRMKGVRSMAEDFNPRSREGSDTISPPAISSDPYFNPRSREGSDAIPHGAWPPEILFQSTLPRGERRRASRQCSCVPGISIHAPARGATGRRDSRFRFLDISIHAPARGATAVCRINDCRSVNFNPRSREGSDRHFSSSVCVNDDFNPRSREGSDRRFFSHILLYVLFQSTLPRGERHQGVIDLHSGLYDFNPRSREGSDNEFRKYGFRKRDFNPRSREGSDWTTPTTLSVIEDFNPRSREGSDAYFAFDRNYRISFQSTLPRGERLPVKAQPLFIVKISIHAPARGAT